MTNILFLRTNCTKSAGFVGLLCPLIFAHCALAQVPEKQWPSMPVVVTAHPNNDEEVGLIPAPILPPDAKSPELDPLISIANPSQEIKGMLAYLCESDYGGHNIVLRSLSGPRMLPVSHTTPPSAKGLSDIASYGFHDGEFGGGNPQFSPDGQVLLYEQAQWRSEYGTGSLYEWDMKAGKVRQLVNEKIAYLNFFWSPDSQSIAYVSGGEESGKPAQLNIVNRSTAKSRPVALPKGVSLMLNSPAKQQSFIIPISWASPTDLLFSGTPSPKTAKNMPAHPNIYEATNGKTSLVVPDAYAPNPSPNGRWIACFGWPDASAGERKKQTSRILPRLYLIDRCTKKRFFVRSLPPIGPRQIEYGDAPPFQALLWTPDSRHLILTEESYQLQGQAGTATLKVSALDIPQTMPTQVNWAQVSRPITTLHSADFVAPRHSILHFGPLQVSADNKHLFLSTLQVTGQAGEPPKEQPVSERALQRVDLTGGKVEVIARFHTDRLQGFDWHETQQ